ncbi:hypothetical protein JKP88DRAFT_347409 [Tribonema minus]|uniref:Uncharacterized protein n=1 Tax=Tribonema minus TaxID=303371 RepID=A0A835ZJI9_9STRA|nr:hypothetical protein JKP88DRAFT_347409 [Tribonema minus]
MGDDIKEPPPALGDAEAGAQRHRSVEARRLSQEAEKYMLQAEKLREKIDRKMTMLAEHDALIRLEKIDRKMTMLAEHDALIRLWRAALEEGGPEGLAAAVHARLSRVDATVFMRMTDLAENSSDATEREALVALSQGIMRVVETKALWDAAVTLVALSQGIMRVVETKARGVLVALSQGIMRVIETKAACNKGMAAKLNADIRDSMQRAADAGGLLGSRQPRSVTPQITRRLDVAPMRRSLLAAAVTCRRPDDAQPPLTEEFTPS